MFDITFNDGSSWWTQIKFTMVYGALVGFGIGIGITVAVLIARHFGWVHV